MTEHPRDDLAAYALGALDEPERRTVAAHVERCDSCAAEVEQYRVALHAYAAAADADAPDLGARLVARATQDTRAGRGGRDAARSDNAWTGWLRRPIPAFVPAALALLLVVSLAGLAQARREADTYSAALGTISSGRVVTLAPTPDAPDARGALVVPESGSPFLLLRLPAPPPGRTWEAWVLRATGPAPAGLGSAGGVFTIVLNAPLASGEGVAVTLEPATGSSAPTSAPVLAVPRT